MANDFVNEFLDIVNSKANQKKALNYKGHIVGISKYIRHSFTDLLKPFIDAYGIQYGTDAYGAYYKLPSGTFFLSDLKTTQGLYIDITNLQRAISKIPEMSKPILKSRSNKIADDKLSQEDIDTAKEGITRITEYEIVSIIYLSGLDIKRGANLAGALKMVLNAVNLIAQRYNIDEAIALSDEMFLKMVGLKQEPNTTGRLDCGTEILKKIRADINDSPDFSTFVNSDDDKYDLKWDAIFNDKLKSENPSYYAKHTQYNKFKKKALADGMNEMDATSFARNELKQWLADPKGYQKAMDRLATHNAKKADVDNSDDE